MFGNNYFSLSVVYVFLTSMVHVPLDVIWFEVAVIEPDLSIL